MLTVLMWHEDKAFFSFWEATALIPSVCFAILSYNQSHSSVAVIMPEDTAGLLSTQDEDKLELKIRASDSSDDDETFKAGPTSFGVLPKMILWTSLGFLTAISHHFLYQHLHGQPVSEPHLIGNVLLNFQQVFNAIGNVMAFIVHTSFKTAVCLLFVQQFWFQIRRRSFSAKSIDAVIDMQYNLLSLSALRLVPSTILIIALIIFSLPAISVVAPGALTVVQGNFNQKQDCNVATIQYPNSATLLGIDDTAAGNASVGASLPLIQKLAAKVLLLGSYIPPPTPCGACEYNITYAAPAIQCSSIASSFDRRQLASIYSEAGSQVVGPIAKVGPKSTSSSIANPIPNSTSSSVPNLIPNSTSGPVPNLTPNSTSSSVANLIPNSTSSSAPSLTPNPTSSSVPNLIPNPPPSSVPNLIPDSTSSSVPNLIPNPPPSSVPNLIPYSTSSSVPSLIPNPTSSSVPERTQNADSIYIPNPVPLKYLVWNATYSFTRTFNLQITWQSGGFIMSTSTLTGPSGTIQCTAHNATYYGHVTHSTSLATMEVTNTVIHNPLEFPGDSSAEMWSMVAIADALATQLQGVVWLHAAGDIAPGSSMVAYGIGTTARSGVSWNWTMDPLLAIPSLMQNISLSMLADNIGALPDYSTITTTQQKCLVSTLMFHYDPIRLAGIYISAALITLFCLVLGIWTIQQNGMDESITFVRWMDAVVHQDILDKVKAGELTQDTALQVRRSDGRLVVPGFSQGQARYSP